jgi:hypothetical protein
MVQPATLRLESNWGKQKHHLLLRWILPVGVDAALTAASDEACSAGSSNWQLALISQNWRSVIISITSCTDTLSVSLPAPIHCQYHFLHWYIISITSCIDTFTYSTQTVPFCISPHTHALPQFFQQQSLYRFAVCKVTCSLPVANRPAT